MLPGRFHALVASLLAIGSGLSCGAENIGGTKQLLIDDRIIASLGGAKRVFKQAVKTEPLLSASTPWEMKRSLAYLSLLTMGLAQAETAPRIAWWPTVEQGRAEAKRSGKPIFLISAAPQCQNISGVW